MKTIVIDIPEEVINETQRAGFEVDSRRGVIDRYLEKHMNDEDESAINSKPFVHFMSLLAEAEAHFELAKSVIENDYVPEFLKGHDYEWFVDYSNCTMTVTVKCDCHIPELDNWDD